MRLVVAALERILEGVFAVGVIGPIAVFVLSGIEDLETPFGREEENHS